ncbi:methyl farnesoate epoxidase-like [Thrips palmi]|uniref:Methyl farnesoate epoxidase-like n=1 Tax=Thrips palmi TaxID=161013 RepID=A0A6P9AC91_THRPL|nr:methyl farnesoate epoxidase-like [Thrips palmi]
MVLGCCLLPIPELSLLLLAVVLLTLLLADIKKPPGYPPGPAWFPVVGTYLQHRQLQREYGYLHEVWRSLSRQYGAVVGLRLGRDRVVVVSGAAAVREVLTHSAFDGRPDGFFFRLRCFGERLGVVFTEGEHWQEQRRFAVRVLKQFGLGGRSMEEQVAEEAAELVTALRARVLAARGADGCVAMAHAFDVSVLNSLWAMLAGRRFALDDERLAGLLHTLNDCFRQTDGSGGLLNQMPFLRHLAPRRCGYTDTVRNLNKLWDFLRETIVEHEQTRVPTKPRDLIDAFLEEMQGRKGTDSTGSTYTEKQLLSLLLDLFMAGAETTSNTLGFTVMFLLRRPDVQRRAQEELDRVVGRGRQPSLQDRPRLNYLEAVLKEAQRLANVAPVGVPHRAMQNATIMGHTVPKDTTVLASLWSVHMDREYWGDPERFRPERFLDDAGLKSAEYLLPFGLGKRRCLGEKLARSNLFMFLAFLLHHFSMEPCPKHPVGDPIEDRHFLDGFTLCPKPFCALLTARDAATEHADGQG